MGTSKNRVGRGLGGARRDRTDDLLHAMQALSQLSYSPTRGARFYERPRVCQQIGALLSGSTDVLERTIDAPSVASRPSRASVASIGGETAAAGHGHAERLRHLAESDAVLVPDAFDHRVNAGAAQGVSCSESLPSLVSTGTALRR